MTIGSDEEIASQVAVNYANVDADQTTATEFSDRLLSGQINTATVQLPLAFTSSEAKGIADAMVADGYASRVGGTMSLPISYAHLVPTDVVIAPADDGTLYRIRIVKRTDSTPLLEFEWVLDDASAVESAGITSGDYQESVSVALPGDTLMALLDCPLLQDSEDQLGHYVAATSRGTTWPGASINRSLDDVEYAEVARVGERGVIGSATTVLGNWTGGKVFDEKNTVTVDVGTTLSSTTRTAMLDDVTVNAMMIGDEVVRYRTATLVSAGIYTLSGLLRGQRGTEWAMGTHAASETVVLLRTAGLRYVPIDAPSLGIARYYKGVTIGRTLATVTGEAFTCEGVSSKPLAPVDVRVAPNTSQAIVVTWKRRTRLSSSFTGPAGAVVPLGEATESYEIDVVATAGPTVLRTLTASTATATYTREMQVADSVGTATALRFDVYQISAVAGRGYAGSSAAAVGAATAVPQITELTVGGTFATGAELRAQFGTELFTHTTVGGDVTLAGAATSLAAVIDASSTYSASAASTVVTVTGPSATPYAVQVGVGVGDNTFAFALTQTAAAASTGQAYVGYVFVSNTLTGVVEPVPSGTTFTLIYERPLYTEVGRISYTTSATTNRNAVFAGLASAMQANATLYNAGYRFSASLAPNGDPIGVTFGPVGLANIYVTGGPSSNALGLSVSVQNPGQESVPADRPQIVTMTLAGTPVTGRVYRATLDGVDYDYTATGGDTTMSLVATGLAAVIDAAASYEASAASAVITIEHASNNVEFTYAGAIVGSTVTLSATVTQEAS
jgi:hypothetical protein